MNAVRRWVLQSALTVAVPAAALAQVQQAAAPAGMLNPTAPPAATVELRAAIEDALTMATTSAAERLARALQMDSTFALARVWRANLIGGPTVAAEAQRAAHDALNDSPGEAVLALAYREAAAGRAVNARRLLAVAAEMMPNDRTVAMWRAVNLVDTARHNALREISARNPDYATSRMQLAAGLVSWSFTITDAVRANGVEALRVAEEAVRLAPQSSGAHHVMGHVLHSLGRDAEATQHLLAATRLQPVAVIAWETLADIYGRDGKFAEVRTAVDSITKYTPSIGAKANGRRQRALTYMSEGDSKRALDSLQAVLKDTEAIDAQGQVGTTLSWMSLLAAGARDSVRAEAHLASFKATNPTPGNLADNGILVSSLIGNVPAARMHLAEYMRLAAAAQNLTPAGARTRDENVHRMTGAVLFAEKKYAEALVELKQGGANPYVALFTIETHKAMKNNREADAVRKALYTSREFTANSTAAAIIRFREKK